MKVNPCINCNNLNVRPYIGRYSTLNCSKIACNSCKREVLVDGCNLEVEELIEIWNRENNPERNISKLKIQETTINRNKRSTGPFTNIKLSGLSDFIWLEYGPNMWLNVIIDVYEELVDLTYEKEVITREELKDFFSSLYLPYQGKYTMTLFDTYLVGFDIDEKDVSREELVKSFNSKILQTLENFHVSCKRFNNPEKFNELLDLMLIIND